MKNGAGLNENDRLAVKEFCARISKLLGVDLHKILLFGSKAEGRATAESDIDLLVLIHDPAMAMRHQIRDEAFEVNLKYGVYISPRIIPLSAYEHPVWRITPFIKGLREKGVVLSTMKFKSFPSIASNGHSVL